MTIVLTKTYPRLWSLDAGIAMVVTDLHGDWDAYQRYRDRFLDLHARERADYLIFTGDLIHSEQPDQDDSLPIVVDVLKLRTIYKDAIIYLCGNHELPHIYGFGLSKGQREYTPAFEAALSRSPHRFEVVELFCALPIYLRTAAGVSITHAGAADVLLETDTALKIFKWNHQTKISEVNAQLAAQNILSLRRAYARLSEAESYEALAKHYLAVTGPEDPRFDDLLRGFMITSSPDFHDLYSALFTRCELEYGVEEYAKILSCLLQHLSTGYIRQRVLVAGHIAVQNGYDIIENKHLRLASSSHARPREAGAYLLFDTACPVERAADLLPNLHQVNTD